MQTMSYHSENNNKTAPTRCDARLDFAQAAFSAVCAYWNHFRIEMQGSGVGCKGLTGARAVVTLSSLALS